MKIIKIFHLAFLSIFVLLISIGCNQKGSSLGSTRTVVVLADSTLWIDVKDSVNSILEIEKFTPQPEYIFAVTYNPPDKLGNLKRFPQLLIVGTLDSEGKTKNLLDQMLPPGSEARALVENDERSYFEVKNPWSKDQLLGVLVSKDLPTLMKNIHSQKQLVFESFDKQADTRTRDQILFLDEQKNVSKKFIDEYGWYIRVPVDYMVAMDSSNARFVWLRKLKVQKGRMLNREMFIYWEQVEDPSVLDKDWIIAKRNELTKEYYQGDKIFTNDQVKVESEIVNFNERYAIKIGGVWQNDSLSVGGAFRTFGFYNESDNRIYLLDCSVFAPEERKWPLLRQLDLLLHTFKDKNELDKKEKS